jgi:hypothetical protein
MKHALISFRRILIQLLLDSDAAPVPAGVLICNVAMGADKVTLSRSRAGALS